MLEKFKLFFNSLNSSDKEEAIRYVLNSQNLKSLNEGFYTGPSKTIEKGLYTGPTSSNEKCKLCGK
jgi:hypothetical protein